ncbi:tRNA-queuosine alpha-mannosyltransferase domain-containing protein [Sessilibacter corallicola]|uniref:tRNA-queuosine alpha-mannosyltransferase domain-containing protein n=1 Tax=Sessilibacter corallicola TaxID=2904075 RepID=UPI001E47FC04|nr:DUF3524 domain-containing protein [Sessilibacter corallicola]
MTQPANNQKRILLLSAYHGQSHERWCRELMAQLTEYHWTLEALPARYFSWRTRGNSLTWGMGEFPNLDNHYDLLLATSMVDLTALRGFRPNLASVPTILYFHENQFAYPDNDKLQGKVEIQLTSLYSALAADKLIFNSLFNQKTFLAGTEALLKKLPDGIPRGLVDQLSSKSSVIPVPVDEVINDDLNHCQRVINKFRSNSTHTVHVLWNHRWEWDKGPSLLLEIVRILAEEKWLGRCFKFHIAGQQFRRVPDAFSDIKAILQQNNALETWGFVDSYQDYQALIQHCDVVLSTASHDFQGLSMIEAVSQGCLPLAPQDLAYPEWFDSQYLYTVNAGDVEKTARNAVNKLVSWFVPKHDGAGCSLKGAEEFRTRDCSSLTWQALKPKYEASLNQYLQK